MPGSSVVAVVVAVNAHGGTVQCSLRRSHLTQSSLSLKFVPASSLPSESIEAPDAPEAAVGGPVAAVDSVLALGPHPAGIRDWVAREFVLPSSLQTNRRPPPSSSVFPSLAVPLQSTDSESTSVSPGLSHVALWTA
jgi:hypothetical protein